MPQQLFPLIKEVFHHEYPDESTIEFPNGKQLEYEIPVLKVQLYNLKDIQRKHLNILIPFLPLRFRSRLKSKQKGKKLTKEELTAFLKEIILILREEEIVQSLSHFDATKLIELLNKSVIRVFHKHEDYLKEALNVTKPILTFETDKWIVFTEKLKAESKQLEDKNSQLEIEKKQSIQIAKLALQGFDAAAIAKEMSIPISAIQSLLEG